VGAAVRQEAPDPHLLITLVGRLKYRKDWRFRVEDIDRGQGSAGLTLVITILCADTYNPDEPMCVNHYMIVPPAAFNAVSWRRWLFEQILLVERHEACEFFQIDDDRPYAPNHAPGNDPYVVFEAGTIEGATTDYQGKRFDPKERSHGEE
jgi:hypothetical protein